MISRNNIRLASAITLFGVMGIAGNLGARENVVTSHHKAALKSTASTTGCLPGATTGIDLDINNVRAHLMTGGDMWWDIDKGIASYEIPKGSGKHSQFAASCWIGGFDKQGQLKVAAQTYRQDGNDYWPGALDVNGKITQGECAAWDNFWKIDKSTINRFIELSKSGGNTNTTEFKTIYQWPAVGNAKATGAGSVILTLHPNFTYAPFKDLNGNGYYEPDKGEYPLINGDQFIWWVFNDAGNVKQQTSTAAIGVEVQTSAFAYSTQDFLNNATFCNYRVINRGPLTIDSTYIAVWDDCDLGWAYDDFIGCDTSRGLGIQYNGTNDDGAGGGHPTNSYGLNPPQVGLDFFQGPLKIVKRPGESDTTKQLGMTNFTYYNNDGSIIGNPFNGVGIYYYMTGSILNGQRFSNDNGGPGVPSRGYGAGPVSNFVFTGDPGDRSQWSECASNNTPYDRRFIFSSGPFTLVPGAINDITFGCIWTDKAGGCPQTSFKTIKNIDDQAQALFDNHFKTIEGPEAPRLVVRELDKKLVFYMLNDYGSNNYAENFGRKDGTYIDSLQYHQVAVKALGAKSPDSLYKFQGYRVFQLANSQVTSAEIFNPVTGEIDNTKAYEVFECDIHDSVKQIVNYIKDINISDTTVLPQIKVIGKDSGIAHSFMVTEDKFATGSDKSFINYHNYYFVAIAYAYNNFASFDPKNPVTTQDVPYLGSAHGAGGTNISVVVATPNPSNGAMGTVLNADYGSGVVVTRVEGIGNGGNDVELDAASELTAVNSNKVDRATYKVGKAPIEVRVVDPVKVPAFNWTLQITDTARSGNVTNTAKWKLTGTDGVTTSVIFSESDISNLNEQIAEDYGLSISVQQVPAPGTNPTAGNGYITSDITFSDLSKPWLWGVTDVADSSFANWLRSGGISKFNNAMTAKNPCNFNDNNLPGTALDPNSNYENMMNNFTPTTSSWGPYVLAASWAGKHFGNGSVCAFEYAYTSKTQDVAHFQLLQDVDLVFTPDQSKWTRCAVIEEQEDSMLAEGRAGKFLLRKHRSWNLNFNTAGDVTYSDNDTEKSMSYFPGYAINQGTGERLNIVFGEDSYLTGDNGNDMLWNPSTGYFSLYDGSVLFGGKHIVYILGTKYDSDKVFVANVKKGTAAATFLQTAYADMQWVGVPRLNPSVPMKSYRDGYIPDTTRLRFRVNRPYAPYFAADTTGLPFVTAGKATKPYYTFSTKDLAPRSLSDTSDRNKLLSRIFAVPNPYYGYSGWEQNRYDTKVRIVNLPAKATIYIYALDGTLVRTLTKNDINTSYLDWDVRNSAGLPIASGMYMMDVKADGIGETVLRWFGATRPLDVTTY
jgi:hypothetical protein